MELNCSNQILAPVAHNITGHELQLVNDPAYLLTYSFTVHGSGLALRRLPLISSSCKKRQFHDIRSSGKYETFTF